MLETEGLTKQFDGLTAVDNVSVTVEEGEIVGLMGPNGSGKTTFTNCVSGVHEPTAGQVMFKGTDITERAVFKNARDGIARTFQTPRVFQDLTVLENIEVPLLNTDRDLEEIEAKARSKIDAVELEHVIMQEASDLSGGQKKLLEFARNLMREPELILMDEPFAGVHPEIKKTMFDRIQALNDNGVSFIIVSHEVDSLYSISDRIVVFDQGAQIASGQPVEIQENERVVEAYLGHDITA
ncbi:ABC transporter ATP-binding protein [Halomicrococcus sp. SG-WS-1]|uniref:ABC transporter ATP-binding protein n=1 Tax=Halomicrococcus sp. SG-WS-1 TaxID=3439057 RepID=UPI003F7A75D3